MSRTIRSTSILMVLLTAMAAGQTVSGPARPAPEYKRLIAINDANTSTRSVLVMTTTRNIASLVITGSTRITRHGSRVSLSSIEDGLMLDCKGVWDTSTSPMSFRATTVEIGGRVMEKRPVNRSRWKIPVSKNRKQSKYTVKPSPAVYKAQQKASSAPQIELTEWKWQHDQKSSLVTGRIKNITNNPFPNVVAVVRYYTPSGRFVLSENAVVGGNELEPGEMVGFEVRRSWQAGYVPAVGKVDVEFHCASGELNVRRVQQVSSAAGQ